MSTLSVLAITRDTPPAFEFEGHFIEFARAGSVAAAFERMSQRPQISEAALRMQHELVLRIAGQVNEILPVRFGAFLDRVELERILDMRRDAIHQALDTVRGRVQMTIRIRGSSPRAVAPQTLDARPGTAYLHARLAAARPPMPPAALAASALVRHLVVDERSDSRGELAAAVYHLIDRGSVREYRELLAGAAQTAAVSGPWPPFAFTPDLWS